MHAWDRLNAQLQPLRQQLLDHPVYASIRDLAGVRVFMQHHVYAVWDFMSLLKALQQRLTCVSIPWLPPTNAFAARLVNEIVLAEETDTARDGTPASHFDLYLDAMQEAGADSQPILDLFEQIRSGKSVTESLAATSAPSAVCSFVEQTFRTIEEGDLPAIASSFTFGREDLLPGLFAKIIDQLNSQSSGTLSAFVYYLDRHVSLDGDQHGPMARKLMTQLCGDEPAAWERATRSAISALEARLALWNAMQTAIENASSR